MIETCNDENIRIWNFHSAILLKIIGVVDQKYKLDCFCSWNNENILVGYENIIKIVELKNKIIIRDLNGHNKRIIYIATFNHPKYGKSIISQGHEDDGIKLWGNI